MKPFGRAALAHWPLDPDVSYLNHGTVGVTPNRVLAVEAEFRARMERAPSQFLFREATYQAGVPRSDTPLVRAAAEAVAARLGAKGPDLVFVDNATTGVNAILRSLPLAPGDDIVLFDLCYGAVRYIADFVARERGARVVPFTVPWPPRPDTVLEAFTAALTPNTKVAIVDHITSESALLFPIAEMAAICRSRGIPVLADGAHVPGMMPLDIAALGVDWYVANLHKWAWTPRSCGILWAAPQRQAGLHPPVISWGLDRGFTGEFDWIGTRNVSAWLAAPAGFDLMDEVGVADVQAWNHRLAVDGARALCERWGTSLPVDESWIGSMVTIPLPESLGGTVEEAARLRDELLYKERIEIQLHPARGRLWVRLSAQVYNDWSDIERLAEAVAVRAR
jgi:isopenicillin-N epimerase